MATLLQVFATLFPDHPKKNDPFARAPFLPADIFAYTGHLLERSGAYHHVAPELQEPTVGNYRKIVVDATMRARAAKLGAEWLQQPLGEGRRLPNVPSAVDDLWRSLSKYKKEKVFHPYRDQAPAPAWWSICLELFMIADEASQGVGFSDDNPFYSIVAGGYVREDLESGNVFRRVQRAPFSLSTAAEDLLCVQAKARTPSIGCTLRSLSHHLALLPPRGQVRARWVEPPFGSTTKEDDESLGLLLVPFPYGVVDDCFRPAGLDPGGKWGWFDTEQMWLPKDDDHRRRRALIDFILSLLSSARSSGERVDAVVLPELALNHAQFMGLARELAKDGQIDFLISGLSGDQHGRPGNFVGIVPFFLLGDARSAEITGWDRLVLIREKHHRWKLDSNQIDAYALKALDRTKNWWERLDILTRSLDILVYRGKTTITTLICEDLARVDPCQALVRAVGPNLLIALLMDGPQFGARWPGRYATVLAEDPGVSVLTFTSFGLIARQNDAGHYDQACSVGLWKDEITGIKKLELPREADALLLNLRGNSKCEYTLDGRPDNGGAHRWEYENHRFVTAADKPDWIKTGLGRS